MADYTALLIALAAVAWLTVLLRWSFGRGRSLVARPPAAGRPWEYGLLVSVAAPADYDEAEAMRARLAAGGVRSTLTITEDGPRVFVFADDERRARALLR